MPAEGYGHAHLCSWWLEDRIQACYGGQRLTDQAQALHKSIAPALHEAISAAARIVSRVCRAGAVAAVSDLRDARTRFDLPSSARMEYCQAMSLIQRDVWPP